jgi:uncharacterized membrane protein YphA (DoxX/SURF4 family)
MSRARVLMIVRLALGVLLLRQGAIGLSDLPHLISVVEAHTAWQSWPILGSLRPVSLALWIGAGEFAVGMFLIGGLLTRVAALGATLLAALSLAAFADLGLVAGLAHAVLLAASLAVLILGGGAGTLDRVLGSMQRRSIEREAEREALRQAERERSAAG